MRGNLGIGIFSLCLFGMLYSVVAKEPGNESSGRPQNLKLVSVKYYDGSERQQASNLASTQNSFTSPYTSNYAAPYSSSFAAPYSSNFANPYSSNFAQTAYFNATRPLASNLEQPRTEHSFAGWTGPSPEVATMASATGTYNDGGAYAVYYSNNPIQASPDTAAYLKTTPANVNTFQPVWGVAAPCGSSPGICTPESETWYSPQPYAWPVTSGVMDTY